MWQCLLQAVQKNLKHTGSLAVQKGTVQLIPNEWLVDCTNNLSGFLSEWTISGPNTAFTAKWYGFLVDNMLHLKII